MAADNNIAEQLQGTNTNSVSSSLFGKTKHFISSYSEDLLAGKVVDKDKIHLISNDSSQIASGNFIEWTVFWSAFVLLMIFDSYCLMQGVKRLTLKQSSQFTLFYFACAIAFWFFVWAERADLSLAMQWSTGYLLEWMLSVDNLFVYKMIFDLYKCPPTLQNKPLFIGIIGVIVLRLVLFVVGEVLYHSITFVYLFLGAFLIYTGIKVVLVEDDDEDDPTQGAVVKWLSRKVPLVSLYDSQGRFFVQVEKGFCDGYESDTSTNISSGADSDIQNENNNFKLAKEQSSSNQNLTNKIGISISEDNSTLGTGAQESNHSSNLGSKQSISSNSPQIKKENRAIELQSTTDDIHINTQKVDSSSPNLTSDSENITKQQQQSLQNKNQNKLVYDFPTYPPGSKHVYCEKRQKYIELETRATMGFLVAACLAATDVIFAVDSASAIIAQVPDIFLAYSACAYATLGLRATFFMVAELIEMFTLLKYGVGFVLVFTGAKLCLHNIFEIPDVLTGFVMISTFVLCTVGSYILDRIRGKKTGFSYTTVDDNVIDND